MAIGEGKSFTYTGGIQTFTIPSDGIYKLECYGAGINSSAKGAYAIRYFPFKKDTVVYIACGGTGGSCGGYSPGGAGGGWNGGGGASIDNSSDYVYATGGSGATHIAITKRGDGQLVNYANYQNEVLIVAGGSSGYSERDGNANSAAAGAGYGVTGYGFGTGQSSGGGQAFGGGGGGWYGGAAAISQGSYTNDIRQRPSGGTSYIGLAANSSSFISGNVTYTNSITAGGGASGTGTAKITWEAETEDYSITYVLNSGTQGANPVTSYSFDTPTFSLPTPTRTNYVFKGWYETEDFSSPVVKEIQIGSVGNRTFYAKWFGPTTYSFGYSGGIQSFAVPFDGVWKLEVYGAKGGDGWGKKSGGGGGWGGYSVNYKALKKGTNLYIGCGGAGGSAGGGWGVGGGYNGGGGGKSSGWDVVGNGGGGGATHIARDTNRGALSAYANYKDEVLIVAGGGGGGGSSDKNWGSAGGAGGGINGSGGGSGATGGSQTGAGGGDWTGTLTGAGFGQGGWTTAAAWGNGGGGGGWYGGGASYGGAAGGSGFIGSSTSPYTVTISGKTYECSTTNGASGGNGSAKLTWMGPTTLFYYKGQPVEQVIYDGVEVESMKFAGTEIF